MSARTFRIRGTASDGEPPRRLNDEVSVCFIRRFVPGRARDGATDEIDVAGDEVVRVELENGFVLWSRADDLVRDYGHHAVARDGTDAWEFTALAPSTARADLTRGERGLLGPSANAIGRRFGAARVHGSADRWSRISTH